MDLFMIWRTPDQRKNYKGIFSKEHAEKIQQSCLGVKHAQKRNNNIAKSMKIKKWYTNNIDNLFCEKTPAGYQRGRTMSWKFKRTAN